MYQMIHGEDGLKSPLLVLIMKHHDRNDSELLFAGMALRDFALQVL